MNIHTCTCTTLITHTHTRTCVRTQIRSFLQPPMEGVVLQTFGAGNVPDNESNSYLIDQLKMGCERGVIIVNCTQCTSGNVTEKYAGGIVSER